VHDRDDDGEANRDVEIVLYYADHKEPQFQSLKDLKYNMVNDNTEWEEV
jgi:hypothetical protein